MSAIQSAVSHLSGTSGYKCVDQKGHLDNCKDPHGVCETNAICRFVDDIKRRGKLDKKEVTYSEANNIENGVNNKSSFELVFGLDYDIESGNRVGLQLISPTVYEFDISIYKYNKVLRMLDETLREFIDKKQQFKLSNPYDAYNLINEIVYENKKKFFKLKTALAKKIEPLINNSIREYIDNILMRLTTVGALYLTFVCYR